MRKTSQKQVDRDNVGRCGKDTTVPWIIAQFVSGKKRLLAKLIGQLEKLDASLTAKQRQLIFYLGLLGCSGVLLYLLGSGPSRYNKQPQSTPRSWVPAKGVLLNSPQKTAESLNPVNAVPDTAHQGNRINSANRISSTDTGKVMWQNKSINKQN